MRLRRSIHLYVAVVAATVAGIVGAGCDAGRSAEPSQPEETVGTADVQRSVEEPPVEEPPPALGAVSWRGDYETGDFGQWAGVQASCLGEFYTPAMVGSSCATVVSSAREGRYAARFEVRSDSAITGTELGGERSEVHSRVEATGATPGAEWLYAWSTLFPAAGNEGGFWPTYGDWNVFTQFHNSEGSCGSNVQLGINATSGTPRMYFSLTSRSGDCSEVVGRQKFDLGELAFDAWYDFVLRVKWSPDPSVGRVELWLNGRRAVPATSGPTLHSDRGAYWKQGFYRAIWDGGTNTVLHDGAVRAAPP